MEWRLLLRQLGLEIIETVVPEQVQGGDGTGVPGGIVAVFVPRLPT